MNVIVDTAPVTAAKLILLGIVVQLRQLERGDHGGSVRAIGVPLVEAIGALEDGNRVDLDDGNSLRRSRAAGMNRDAAAARDPARHGCLVPIRELARASQPSLALDVSDGLAVCVEAVFDESEAEIRRVIARTIAARPLLSTTGVRDADGLFSALGRGPKIEEVRMPVRGILTIEVTIGDRQDEALLPFALLAIRDVTLGVPIAVEAVFLGALGTTTVVAYPISVVAFLSLVDVAIATGRGARLGHPCVGIAAIGFSSAGFRTAFAVSVEEAILVARIATFTSFGFTPVAAHGDAALTWLPAAGGARRNHAVAVAAIVIVRVLIVAALSRFTVGSVHDQPIPADGEAVRPGRAAFPALLDRSAVRGAAIPVLGVVVVAGLAHRELAVAALRVVRAAPSAWTRPIALDLTGRVAPVSAVFVAIVAGLVGVVVQPITARFRKSGGRVRGSEWERASATYTVGRGC